MNFNFIIYICTALAKFICVIAIIEKLKNVGITPMRSYLDVTVIIRWKLYFSAKIINWILIAYIEYQEEFFGECSEFAVNNVKHQYSNTDFYLYPNRDGWKEKTEMNWDR